MYMKTMAKWTVLSLIAISSLVACSKRSDRNTSLETANALNANCLNTGNFNNQLFNNGTCGLNTNNGVFQQYPVSQTTGYYEGYTNNYQQGFNSCPYGTVPTSAQGTDLTVFLFNTFKVCRILLIGSTTLRLMTFRFMGIKIIIMVEAKTVAFIKHAMQMLNVVSELVWVLVEAAYP